MMNKSLEGQIVQLKKYLQMNPSIQIIGICGIPGAGKSTVSQMIPKFIDNAIVLSMDGYHIERKYLDEQGMRRRGAPFTFDMKAFKQKVLQITNRKKQQQIKYPTFDHKQKDPIFDAITIPAGNQLIFIEGIYTFDKNEDLNNFWDLKIWISAKEETAIERMAKRHVQAGIVQNLQQAYQRIETSDRLNMEYILENCHCSEEEYFTIYNE